MTSSPSEAVTPDGNAVTAQTYPPTYGDAGPAPQALPQRIGGILLSATPVRTTQPLADPNLLCRVLDGLKQL
jgi:hypothetical protein